MLAVLINAFLVMTLIPTTGAQYGAAVLFGPMRTLQWASFYRIVGANVDLYEPAAVGRTLGYNGLVIALVGDGLSPLLMAYAGQATGPANEIERFQHVKYGLLAVLLPITLSVPAYLYKVTRNVKAA